MVDTLSEVQLEVFCTCPQSFTVSRDRYVDEVKAVARWSEACGCKGILVYTDNSLVHSWLVSQRSSCKIPRSSVRSWRCSLPTCIRMPSPKW